LFGRLKRLFKKGRCKSLPAGFGKAVGHDGKATKARLEIWARLDGLARAFPIPKAQATGENRLRPAPTSELLIS